MTKLSSIAICLVFGFWVYVGYRTEDLPSYLEILPDILNEPVQVSTNEEEFTFDYRFKSYTVQPVAEYELWGLVVTHNDISAFSDIYHDGDSVDIKDLCVVWGANVTDNNFHKVTYSSDPWTCFYRTDDLETFNRMAPDSLSNNHLLSENPEVRRRIRKTRIGDQIYLKGLLVNYYPTDEPRFVRRTSVSRDDTGNGACEVILVDHFEILREANRDWRRLNRFLPFALTLLVIVRVGLFLRSAYVR